MLPPSLPPPREPLNCIDHLQLAGDGGGTSNETTLATPAVRPLLAGLACTVEMLFAEMPSWRLEWVLLGGVASALLCCCVLCLWCCCRRGRAEDDEAPASLTPHTAGLGRRASVGPAVSVGPYSQLKGKQAASVRVGARSDASLSGTRTDGDEHVTLPSGSSRRSRAPVWTEYEDDHTGDRYYVNKQTGQTSWDPPAAGTVIRGEPRGAFC